MAASDGWKSGEPSVTQMSVTIKLTRGGGEKRVDATVTIHRGAFDESTERALEKARWVGEGLADLFNELL